MVGNKALSEFFDNYFKRWTKFISISIFWLQKD